MLEANKNYIKLPKYISPTITLLLIGLLFRLIVMKISNSSINEIELMKEYAKIITETPFKEFYINYPSASDYPPIILYILFLLGKIISFFKLSYSDNFELVNYIFKLPSILFDLISILILYKISLKRFNTNNSFVIGLFYALNPAIILVSSIWGQLDTLYTTFLLISVYFLTEENLYKKILAYSFYILALFTLPHLIILSPLYVIFFLSTLFSRNIKVLKKLLFFVLALISIAISIIVICFPIVNLPNYYFIIEMFIEPFKSINYATIYAYNFHALLGGNLVPSFAASPLVYSYFLVGLISMAVLIFLTLIYLFRNLEFKVSYFFSIAFVSTSFFIFGTGIHERYLYLSIMFLLLSYVYSKNKEYLVLFFAFTTTLFINCSDVLRMYGLDNNQDVLIYGLAIIPFVNFILFFNMFLITFDKSKNLQQENTDDVVQEKKKFFIKLFNPKSPLKIPKFKYIDWVFIISITVIYSSVALINVGNNNNPQSTFIGQKNDKVYVEFSQIQAISRITTLLGARNNKDLTITYFDYITEEETNLEINYNSVFKWEITPVSIVTDKITITYNNNETMIQEMAFLDPQNDAIVPHKISQALTIPKDEREDLEPPFTDNAMGLFDEPELIQTNYNYMNSTYFDEIYHPRTGYEFANQLKVYEYTHPPLGKVIMAAFIKYMGMNPFAYRLPGIIAGILMVPLMYLFGRQIFKNSYWALFVATIFAFDFMHFTQTRIATIDSYITLFVIAMFYFMYKFYRENYFSTPLVKTLFNLFLSGFFMGLGIATKWTGIYAGLGLAIIFFKAVLERYKEYLYTKENFGNNTTFKIYPFYSITGRIGKDCVMFFIVIPIIIYVLVYIPYMNTPSMTDGISGIIRNQQNMLSYHGDLKSTHPFMSSWWTWPLIVRPIYYYSKLYTEHVAGISAFGNPALWWTGIIALFYCFNMTKGEDKKDAWFLIIAYFAQFLPWIFVSRTTYIYHYFPSTPFVALMVAFMFKDIFKTVKNFWVILYLILLVGLFVMFYPVLSGMPVPDWYPSIFLKWFDTWVLVPGR